MTLDHHLNLSEKILNWFFPYYAAHKGNKKILAAIKDIEALDKLPCHPEPEYMGNYRNLSVAEALVFLDKTLEKKRALEDKAKINIFGVTIAVSLITGLFTVVTDIKSIQFNMVVVYKIGLLVLALYSVGMMVWAGLISLKVLSNEIMQYELFPNDMRLSKQNKRDVVALVAELNNKTNFVRNNYLSASYDMLKKSLGSVMLLFFFFALLMQLVPNSSSSIAHNPSKQHVNSTNKKIIFHVSKSVKRPK